VHWGQTAQLELLLLLRILIAGGLAAIVGWERERAGKAAGFRTHMLVCMAAALYTAIGTMEFNEAATRPDGLRADPIRVIQAVALGIGFLGSGVIRTSKDGEEILGLTTAASIWATAAIGIAAGFGRFVLAAGATLLLAVVLHLLPGLESVLKRR
jgi:putative Mg2+ transporter-C (MgtC) family protein